MRSKHSAPRYRSLLIGCAIGAMTIPWSAVHADKRVHEQQAVDPHGSIDIVNVAGTVQLIGWDRPEIEVTGSSADNVERVEITTKDSMSSIHVITQQHWHMGMRGEETQLIIHVPKESAISANLVSSDLSLHDLKGDVRIQTVSGDVTGEVGGDLHFTGVSGDVKLRAPAAKVIEVKTISGDIQIFGGSSDGAGSDGEANITTVSGEAKVELPALSHGHFKSVSGDMTVRLGLAANGQLEGESVSGALHFDFAKLPDADFDVQSFSGDIDNCFGPKPMESHYGPGSRLSFKSMGGSGHVRIQSKSGDITVCARDKHGAMNYPTQRHRESFMVALTHFRPML
jgi:putative adhesin